MQAWQSMIGSEVRARREELVDYCLHLGRSQPGALPRRDIAQMIDGYIAVICEAADERPATTRELFLETVIPSLFKAGVRIPDLARGVIAWNVYVSAIVVQALPPEHRVAAADWFANFFGDWNRDIIVCGLAAAAG